MSWKILFGAPIRQASFWLKGLACDGKQNFNVRVFFVFTGSAATIQFSSLLTPSLWLFIKCTSYLCY